MTGTIGHGIDGRTPAVGADIFRRGAVYRSRDRAVTELGNLKVEISLAPPIMLHDDAAWLRRCLRHFSPLPSKAERRDILRSALVTFASGEVRTTTSLQTATQFAETLGLGYGLPRPLVESWTAVLVRRLDQLSAEPLGGLELVSLPANTFVCLEACLVALLRSEAVWIRPSRREPFSADRLVGSLLAAGWPAARLALYPTPHEGLLTAVGLVDRAVVFGSGDLITSLSGRPNVEFRGPGHACALVGADVDIDRASHWLTRLIAAHSGRFCSNIGTILCAGNTDRIGAMIATALDQIGLGTVTDSAYPLANLHDQTELMRHARWLETRQRDDDLRLTARPILVEADGVTVLAPTLIKLGRIEDHPLLGLELPFPVACIATAPADRQPSLCGDAGYIYLLGSPPTAALPTKARVTVIDLEADHAWPM